MKINKRLSRLIWGSLAATYCLFSGNAAANNPLNLASSPLYVAQGQTPMVMLVLGRDHTLYYEAYNDASDLNGNGSLNLTYSPQDLDYYGYFDSHKCYQYTDKKFIPKSVTTDKKCSSHSYKWSGDFLNYLTMSRMDVLRKVLYGGYRRTDDSDTVLERAFIPLDAHSWGKSYTSLAEDGYLLTDYADLPMPEWNKSHFFGTASFVDNGVPELHIVKNQSVGIWEWASTERPVLKNRDVDKTYRVRVKVCVDGLLETNCKLYPDGNYKPVGLLHEYGESGAMDFGLITGSYDRNLSGGILRKAVKGFSDEVDSATGRFKDVAGIVKTINALRVHGFNYTGNGDNYSYVKNCGWVTAGPISSGQCASWGNPIGEMLYESLRYFYGKKAPSSDYQGNSSSYDDSIGLSRATWDDPYSGREYCTAAHNLVISDINPSYDSDELPGSSWGSYSGQALSDFSISTLLSTISTEEKIDGNYFIGELFGNTGVTQGAPVPKKVTDLGKVRGLSQEPTKQGSYSAAGVAYYGLKNDRFPDKPKHQGVKTSVVALSSPLPELDIDVGGKTISLVPFAKSVGQDLKEFNNPNDFYPTNTIVDYYIESITDTSGSFRINFEDVEQGADHDMDVIIRYSYEVKDDLCPLPGDTSCADKKKGLVLTLEKEYQKGGIIQHAGYIVSGTTADGMYLDVRDEADIAFALDTVAQDDLPYPSNKRTTNDNKTKLPTERTRHFFPSSTPAEYLPSPLWYAAKWGGFDEGDDQDAWTFKPDATDKWDSNGDGVPDAFFLASNAGELGEQISDALENIAGSTQSTASPVFSDIFLRTDSFRYQSYFNSEDWDGDIKAYAASGSGFSNNATWSAAEQLDGKSPATRKIFTRNPDSRKVFEFTSANLPGESLTGSNNSFSSSQLTQLLDGMSGTEAQKLAYLSFVVDYLRGVRTGEGAANPNYTDVTVRERSSVLGDIVNSTPYLVSPATGHDVAEELLVFGANDGMVHLISSSSGEEVAAYIPTPVYDKLTALSKSTYTHNYYVDGGISAFTDSSGDTTLVGMLGAGYKGLYAIDVSDLSSPSSSDFLWEITLNDTGYNNIGHSVAPPTIAKLNNGKTGVIFSSGYNPADGTARLYIADIDDGSLIKTISTTHGPNQDPSGAGRANALASPTVIDFNGDGVADRVYAGDLFGNLWAFDIGDDSDANWQVAHSNAYGSPAPLFTALSPLLGGNPMKYLDQPITSRPSVGAHPLGLTQGVLVSFGTGKFIESSDTSVTGQATQSFYTIWDKFSVNNPQSWRNQQGLNASRNGEYVDIDGDGKTEIVVGYSNLLQQAIIEEDAKNRRLTDFPIDWSQHDGWFIDLVNMEGGGYDNKGERQVTDSLLLTNKVVFTTLIPDDDVCVAGGSGWYMELNLHNGQTWYKGANGGEDPSDPDDTSNTIADDSSHQKVDGIPSAPKVILDPVDPYDDDEEDEGDPGGEPPGPGGDDEDPEDCTGEPGCVIEKVCVTLSDGSLFCRDDYKAPTGRLSWRQLY